MQDCISKALGLLERNENARFLDLGCGDGEITLRAAEVVGAKEVYGVDISESLLKLAEVEGIKVCKGDLNEALPFKDNLFDVAFSNPRS
jgi:ubiquinone/menaquinone biosynthesis C-methylase UbiE